jgi:hypothetical protein
MPNDIARLRDDLFEFRTRTFPAQFPDLAVFPIDQIAELTTGARATGSEQKNQLRTTAA